MAEQRISILSFYTEEVLAALAERLDQAFPEFGWTRDRDGWIASNQETTHRLLGVREPHHRRNRTDRSTGSSGSDRIGRPGRRHRPNRSYRKYRPHGRSRCDRSSWRGRCGRFSWIAGPQRNHREPRRSRIRGTPRCDRSAIFECIRFRSDFKWNGDRRCRYAARFLCEQQCRRGNHHFAAWLRVGKIHPDRSNAGAGG